MYEKYFVLVTDHIFGVFAVNAASYPDEFLDNISAACTKNWQEIMPYLLEKVGRNALIRSGFHKVASIGMVYTY